MTARKRQSGSTLIELILVAALVAVMVSATISLFGVSRSGSGTSKLLTDIHLLSEAVENYLTGYGHPGNGSINKWLIEARKVPSGLSVSRETIATSFDGTIDIRVLENAYSISISHVPKASCIAFLSALPTSWQIVKVGGDEITDRPISVAQANSSCQLAKNDIVLQKDFF